MMFTPVFGIVHERRRAGARAGFAGRDFAEEVVLLDGGEAGVRVGAADQAELVRIHAELRLELEAVLERGAGIFEFEHLLFLRGADVEIAFVPRLVVGELVVRREEGMRLAVALRLRGLVEPLPFRARLGILAVDGFAEGLDDRETSCRCSGCRCARWRARCRRSSFRRRPSISTARSGLLLPSGGTQV